MHTVCRCQALGSHLECRNACLSEGEKMLFVLLCQDANIFNKNIQLTLFCAVIMFSKKITKGRGRKKWRALNKAPRWHGIFKTLQIVFKFAVMFLERCPKTFQIKSTAFYLITLFTFLPVALSWLRSIMKTQQGRVDGILQNSTF